MFCYDKKEIKEIEEKWDNMGPPDVCFIISKNDKYYVLAYLDAHEYYPFYFKKTPVEDILPADEEEEQYLCDELKPKVLQVLTNYATIELRGNKYKIPRYEYLKELKAKQILLSKFRYSYCYITKSGLTATLFLYLNLDKSAF